MQETSRGAFPAARVSTVNSAHLLTVTPVFCRPGPVAVTYRENDFNVKNDLIPKMIIFFWQKNYFTPEIIIYAKSDWIPDRV